MGTVTFLFTDIEGSTRLWEAQPDVMREALARHDALLREAIRAGGGHVFKTIGDAFCAAFATAGEGLAAAQAAQISLISEPWAKETPIRVRMALHTGAAESRDSDYFGPPLNRVARLLSAAHGGQSLLSQATYELVRDSISAPTGLKDLGSHQLKDLARPEQIYQLVHPALLAEFPPLRSLSNHPNNLPLQLTSFIGREALMEQVQSLLQSSRLVTLVGAGGSGKTRLSIQVAADLLESFPAGVWLAELASVSDSEALVQTIANALGVHEDPSHNLSSALASHIGSKTMLLLLDNCEHLLAGASQLADSLLKTCPNLKIITTSREALAITGETVLRVPPLDFPDPTQPLSTSTLSQYGAVRLFIDRALKVDPWFEVTNENAPAVASVCSRLDGIPLAIELAAARVRTLSVEQIEERLESRFQLLTGGSRVALPRQQTLRALIGWSYELLKASEKRVLQRLSVFSGGWTLDASEVVCGEEEIKGWEVTEIVLSLAEKSLVVVHERPGANRFSLLESVREFARDLLSESGLVTVYQDRHLSHFVSVAEVSMAGLRGPDQKKWLERLDPDQDNFRSALRHGAGTAASLMIAGNLWRFWYYRGQLTEGRSWLVSALNQNPDADPELRAQALNGAGVLAEYQGDYDVALEFLRQSAEICHSRGDRWPLAMALNNIGNVHASQGDYQTAESFWRRAYRIWQEMDAGGVLTDVSGMAASLDNLGNVALLNGNLGEARDFYGRGFELRRDMGNLALASYSLVNLGALETQAGNPVIALGHFRQGLEISLDFRDNFAIAYLLVGIAFLAQPSQAAFLFGRCEALREELGVTFSKLESEEHAGAVNRIRDHLGEPELNAAWAIGRAMSLSDAVELARRVTIGNPRAT